LSILTSGSFIYHCCVCSKHDEMFAPGHSIMNSGTGGMINPDAGRNTMSNFANEMWSYFLSQRVMPHVPMRLLFTAGFFWSAVGGVTEANRYYNCLISESAPTH
jgi:hypothetical protein